MWPHLSSAYSSNMGLRSRKQLRSLSVGELRFPDSLHGLFGQCRIRVVDSSSIAESLFCAHVLKIIFLSSKKEMLRTNAWRVVAAMKNAFSSRNLSVMQFPRKSMGPDRPVIDSNNPIARFVAICGPFPALARFYDVSPKPFSRSFHEAPK